MKANIHSTTGEEEALAHPDAVPLLSQCCHYALTIPSLYRLYNVTARSTGEEEPLAHPDASDEEEELDREVCVRVCVCVCVCVYMCVCVSV
jgi:hypothetical protein